MSDDLPPPTKAHRKLCVCGAEPEAHFLRTGIKLLADTVRFWGWTNRKQESNGELVGRALHDMHAEIGRLRAIIRVNALRAGLSDAEIDKALSDKP